MATTVIIPVYNALAALRRCLASLRQHNQEIAHLILINDASPDPEVADELASLASFECSHRVLSNPTNLGFVGTVNRGLAHSSGDVLLLNSDTVVSAGWLTAIERCAASDPTIATITPFSNNAEICSIPTFCQANPEPDNLEAVAASVRAAGNPSYLELPTAVGFCMWIRRVAINAIGDFDQATFGRGYGEENDFCMRARAHGWRNVICDDAYVVHQGGQSFSAEGLSPGGENLQRLLARYPSYNAEVAEFIAADPLAPRRLAIAAALAQVSRETA